jgi:hypothetical protein
MASVIVTPAFASASNRHGACAPKVMNSLMASPERTELKPRRIPYPFRAMLAVCSDLDETPDRHVYCETLRFLNTRETTRMGTGLGLEVGNTIYFDMPPDQFAYWNTDDTGRAMARSLMQSGHIDCLHSFGDLATTRTHAGRALDELARSNCHVKVWIDHGVAPSNFGADIMQGQGDITTSDVYHADLTHSYGVRYVWRGRVTSVIGQNVRRRLSGIGNRHHPLASMRTILKEILKGGTPNAAQGKYAMHADNHVLRRVRLRSGHAVNEFLRANPHWGGVSRGETAEGIHEVLTQSMLDHLTTREGICILYTHLGKIRSREEPLGPQARAAFQRLAVSCENGKVLVTTTRRLLDYCHMLNNVVAIAHTQADGLRIEVTSTSSDPVDWSGLSFDVPDPQRTTVFLNGRQWAALQRNSPDQTQRASVSIPWTRLEWPAI